MTVRRAPVKVNTDQKYTPLPQSVFDRNRAVTLCADVMHVNGIAFFVTRSRNIRFATIEAISNVHKVTLLKSIKQVVAVYSNGLCEGRFANYESDFERSG